MPPVSPLRRRWPPPPSVEDEAVALAKEANLADQLRSGATADDEVVARGAVDQQPIILEVATRDQFASERSSVRTKSSSESLGPPTPVNALDANYDRRYNHIIEKGTEMPISDDDSYESQRSSSVPHEVYARGRKNITPLRTDVWDTQEQLPVDSSRREPSPYAYTPSSQSGRGRYSGDSFLSPDVMYTTAWNNNASKVRDTVRSERGQSAEPRSDQYHRQAQQGRRSPSGPFPARPSVVRHHSAMADPGSRVRAESLSHPSDLESSSDESEIEADGEKHSARPNNTKTTGPSGHNAPTYSKDQIDMPVKVQSQASKRRTLSPRRRPVPAHDNRTPSTSVSLPSGLTPHMLPDLDAYFASNSLKQRNKVQQPSPLTSPLASPLPSPRLGGVTLVNGSLPYGPRSRPQSRPVSPVSVQPLVHNLSHLDSNGSTLARSARDGHRSKRSSPLPSPEIKEYSPRPGPRIDIQAAPPASGGRSYSSAGDGQIRPVSRQPSPTPLSTAQSGFRPRSREPYQRSSSYAEPGQHLPPMTDFFNLSPAVPLRSRPTTPKSPVDVATPPPPLPACPRPAFVSGYNDWYTLVGRPNFDVCPACMEHAVGHGYNAWFARAPPKPPGLKTKCDFSSPWVRVAWLKTLKEKSQKPDILYAVASITEEPCPGKAGAVRAWYSLPDPETGKAISNFDVCPYCVRAIECIFPSLCGVFRYDRKQKSSKQRVCDLRYDSKRFAGYVDRLEAIANRAEIERRSPRMQRFADYAQDMALTRECPRDDMVLNQPWHIMPQIPHFTVCEECYDEVVWPAIEAGSLLAAKFNRSMQISGPGGVSCQLYSPRMRHIFKDAARSNDLAYLQQHAGKRHNVERSLQARHAQAQAYGDNEEIVRIVQEWKNRE